MLKRVHLMMSLESSSKGKINSISSCTSSSAFDNLTPFCHQISGAPCCAFPPFPNRVVGLLYSSLLIPGANCPFSEKIHHNHVYKIPPLARLHRPVTRTHPSTEPVINSARLGRSRVIIHERQCNVSVIAFSLLLYFGPRDILFSNQI